MAQHRRVIISPSDALLIRFLEPIEKAVGSTAQFHLTGVPNPFVRGDELCKRVIKENGRLIDHAQVSTSGINVVVFTCRSLNAQNQIQPHPFLAVVDVTISDHQPPQRDTILDVNFAISSAIRKNALDSGPTLTDPEEEGELNSKSAVLTAIQTAAADQIASTNQFFQQLVTQFDQRRIDLDEAVKAERAKLSEEAAAQLERLQSETDALELKKKELDDRNNTHVRREIRRSINEQIQGNLDNFSFRYLQPRNVAALHVIYVSMVAFFGTLSIYFAYRLSSIPFDIASSLNMNLAVLGIKQTASIVALVFSASLYVRFLNSNLKRAADFEFMIRHFQLDIERASWAVETALEWRRDQGGQMPDALLAGVTKDLFKRPDSPAEPETTAADSLASALLGNAARAQIETPFGKLDYDAKGIRRLEKEKPSA